MTDHNVYHVYCNGYSKTCMNIVETQAFVDVLRTRNCVGKEIVVTVGRGNDKVAVYGVDRKERREILSA